MKETDMLAAKIDLLLKKFDERATDVNTGTVKTMDMQMMCDGHSGNDCPKTCKEEQYINNGYRQTWVMWNLSSFHLEIVLVSVQDRCMVGADVP
jgi:hypothetical protein